MSGDPNQGCGSGSARTAPLVGIVSPAATAHGAKARARPRGRAALARHDHPAALQRVTVREIHALTGADIDGLRKLPGYDAKTDTLDFDVSRVAALIRHGLPDVYPFNEPGFNEEQAAHARWVVYDGISQGSQWHLQDGTLLEIWPGGNMFNEYGTLVGNFRLVGYGAKP